MSTWQYAVTVTRIGSESIYEVREVYSETDQHRLSWTADAVGPSGSTWQEFQDDLALMVKDTARLRVLDITNPDEPVIIDLPGGTDHG